MSSTLTFGERLAESPVYQNFRDHPFFAAVDSAELTKEQAAILIEQWWHPLHYFPTFLARASRSCRTSRRRARSPGFSIRRPAGAWCPGRTR